MQVVMTMEMPGVVGPAPPTANGPPGAGLGTGTVAGTGTPFADAIAAALATANTASGTTTVLDGTVTTLGLDLEHLLLGMTPDAGKPGTAGAPGVGFGLQPDRLAGAESDQTGIREAYQALMAMLVAAPTITQATPLTVDAGIAVVAPIGTTTGTTVGALGELLDPATAAVSPTVAGIAPSAAGQEARSGALAGTTPASASAAEADRSAGIAAATQSTAGSPATAAASAATGSLASSVTTSTASSAAVSAVKVDVAALAADPLRQPQAPATAAMISALLADAPDGAPRVADTSTTAAPVAGVADLGLDSLGMRLAEAGSQTPGAGSDGPGNDDEASLTMKAAIDLQPQLAVAARFEAPLNAATATTRIDAPVEATNAAAFATRVADTVQTATLTGDREVKLVLNPPDLGELTVHIVDTPQGVRVQLQATSAAARELIEQHLPALQTALEARDLRVERLQVGYTAPTEAQQGLDWNGAAFQRGSGQQDPQDGGPAWSPVAAMGRGEATGNRSQQVMSASASRSGRLDVMA